MAIYLGDTKVSPVLKVVDPDNPGSEAPVITPWVRPTGWPNLDNISIAADFEGVYLTYDNTSKVDYHWASFYCTTNTGQYTVALGHMNGNTWVQDSTVNVTSGAYKEVDYSSSSYDYVVFKVTPATATNHLTSFYFARVAAATLGTIALRPQQAQRCLERRGRLPYVTSLQGSEDNYRYCTEWMEYDNVVLGESVTTINLAAGWYRGRRLQKINFNGWPTRQWNVTTVASMFEQCNTIQELDLSSWDTSNWHITTINSMFAYCFNLKRLLVPFDTHNWGNGTGKTLTMGSTWYCCHSLEDLDLSTWDMSNINVTTLSNTWYQCYHLKRLNVKNWVTTKWVVTNLQSTWCDCRALVDIDLSGWNTTTWKPTRMDNIFLRNYKRRNFDDIKNWNTTNWVIVQFNDAFGSCFRVNEIDLSNWVTTNWHVSTLSNTFGSCYNARHIRIGTWNTSNWAVTNFNYTFVNDWNLEELEWFNWDTSNWNVTSAPYQTCMACMKITEADFTQWGSNTWKMNDLRYMFQYCYNLKKINVSNLDAGNITSLTYYANSASGSQSYSPFYGCYTLEELSIPANYKGHISLATLYCLPREQIINVFNSLSSTPISGAKVWIGEQKFKLTTADIAIATNKGYTVVQ